MLLLGTNNRQMYYFIEDLKKKLYLKTIQEKELMVLYIVNSGKREKMIHKDCNTKEENGCWYGSCFSCDFYTTKNKKGEITYYKWNPVEKKHEIHKVP